MSGGLALAAVVRVGLGRDGVVAAGAAGPSRSCPSPSCRRRLPSRRKCRSRSPSRWNPSRSPSRRSRSRRSRRTSRSPSRRHRHRRSPSGRIRSGRRHRTRCAPSRSGHRRRRRTRRRRRGRSCRRRRGPTPTPESSSAESSSLPLPLLPAWSSVAGARVTRFPGRGAPHAVLGVRRWGLAPGLGAVVAAVGNGRDPAGHGPGHERVAATLVTSAPARRRPPARRRGRPSPRRLAAEAEQEGHGRERRTPARSGPRPVEELAHGAARHAQRPGDLVVAAALDSRRTDRVALARSGAPARPRARRAAPRAARRPGPAARRRRSPRRARSCFKPRSRSALSAVLCAIR